jgi:quinol monooxygenase YgiN
MVTLAVVYTFPEVRLAEAEAHLREMIPATRAEAGCLRYEVFRASETPRTFFLFEQYRDEAALEAHRESAYFAKHVRSGIQPLAERREATLYSTFE